MLDDSEETVGKKKDAQAATGKLRNPNPEGGKLKVQGRKKHAKSKLSESWKKTSDMEIGWQQNTMAHIFYVAFATLKGIFTLSPS